MNLYKSTRVHDVVPKQSSMYLQKIRNGSCILFEDLWCNITNKQVSVTWAHLGSPKLSHLFVVVKVHHQIKSCWRWAQFMPSELMAVPYWQSTKTWSNSRNTANPITFKIKCSVQLKFRYYKKGVYALRIFQPKWKMRCLVGMRCVFHANSRFTWYFIKW